MNDDQRSATDRNMGSDEDLPEHEFRKESSVGGGIMSSGGTAEDLGTGTMSGRGGPTDESTEMDPPDAVDLTDFAGLPAAAFDQRTMDAENDQSESDDRGGPA
ncbi:MAG: hypothetical protein WKF56_06675 [Candidatus Limnocylindrales bacterium]